MTSPTFETCDQCGFPDIDKTHPKLAYPVPEIFSTHLAVPLHPQVLEIDACVQDLNNSIEHLTQHIDSVKPVLEKLQNGYRAIQRRRAEYRAFLAPIRRLHLDILADIFLLCPKGVTREELPDVLDSANTKSGPLLLSQVCKSWRAVALDTPKLWTTIRVVADQETLSQNELTRLWLSRSKTLPLTVGIFDAQRMSLYNIRTISTAFTRRCENNNAFNAVLSQSHRWENIYVSFPLHLEAWSVLSPVKDNLNHIKHLSLNTSTSISQSFNRFVVDVFASIPSIRHLSLDRSASFVDCRFTRDKLIVKLPYESITSLSILERDYDVCPDICLEIIQRLRNLRECTVKFGHLQVDEQSLPEVHNPYLHTLTLIPRMLYCPSSEIDDETDDGYYDQFDAFFDCLDLPVLERFTLSCHIGGWDHSCIARFFAKSPDINFFQLIDVCAQLEPIPDSFVDALRNLQNVSHLVLCGMGLHVKTALEAIAFKDKEQPLFPGLRRLELHILHMECIDELVDIIRARTVLADVNCVSRLEFFKCDAQFGLPSSIEGSTPQLDELVTTGMQIEFTVNKQPIFSSSDFPRYLVVEEYSIAGYPFYGANHFE